MAVLSYHSGKYWKFLRFQAPGINKKISLILIVFQSILGRETMCLCDHLHSLAHGHNKSRISGFVQFEYGSNPVQLPRNLLLSLSWYWLASYFLPSYLSDRNHVIHSTNLRWCIHDPAKEIHPDIQVFSPKSEVNHTGL